MSCLRSMEEKMNKIYISTALLLSSVLITPSCVPVAAVSSTVVGTTIAQERTAGDRLDDNIIKLKVQELFIQADTPNMYESIDVNVHEGRVLLTGSVQDAKNQQDAAKLAWKVRSVNEVINEIVVNEKDPLRDTSKDIYLANAVRSKLLLEDDLRSVNYIVETNMSVVYLLGVAQDQNELNRALKVAGSVKGVRKIVNHVILKNDPRRNAKPINQE